MPRKIQRTNSNQLARRPGQPFSTNVDIQLNNSGALALGGGAVVLGAGMGAKATSDLITKPIQALAQSSVAFFGYIEECQRTKQVEIWSHTVLAEARERTHQIECQAEAMVAIAEEKTRKIQIQAKETRARLSDTKEARDAKISILNNFLEQQRELHKIITTQHLSSTSNLSIEDRDQFNKYRDDLLQRLRELEQIISTLTQTL